MHYNIFSLFASYTVLHYNYFTHFQVFRSYLYIFLEKGSFNFTHPGRFNATLEQNSNISNQSEIQSQNRRQKTNESSKNRLGHRLMCVVLTIDKYHDTRAKAVNRTWARRCDETVFSSNAILGDFNFIDSGINKRDKSSITERLFETLRILYRTRGAKFDWFYIADDDTYLIAENLRLFLSKYNSTVFHYMGFMYKTFDNADTHKSLKFAHGGPGFVLSRMLLKYLVEHGISKGGTCLPFKQPGNTGDVNIGWCLNKLGVHYTSTIDKYNRQRFCKENPIPLLRGEAEGELKMFGYRDITKTPRRVRPEYNSVGAPKYFLINCNK